MTVRWSSGATRPPRTIRPALGARSPTPRRSRVVLSAPFGPVSATRRGPTRSKPTPFRTGFPADQETPMTSNIRTRLPEVRPLDGRATARVLSRSTLARRVPTLPRPRRAGSASNSPRSAVAWIRRSRASSIILGSPPRSPDRSRMRSISRSGARWWLTTAGPPFQPRSKLATGAPISTSRLLVALRAGVLPRPGPPGRQAGPG